MPSAGYAALQVIPSMRGIDGMIRASLVQPLGQGGEQAGQAAGDGIRKKLTAGLAVAGVAAGALIMGGLTKAMEQANISSTLQAQLGTTGKVAAKHGKLAGKLYSTGVAGSFQEAADAIKATVQSGLAPPGATNKQLESIATKASDVANVFGQDMPAVTNAAAQAIRTGLAKNSSEAFDLITKGFQSGADKAGDFLDTINEYGTQFRKFGLDGATAVGLLNQGIKAGARDADVVADAIKEFSIRAVDGSKTSADGFKALGLNADEMAAKFGKGGKSATGALDTTLDRLRNIKDPVKQSAAAVNLFGTQSEDLGEALFALDPSSAAKGLGKVGGAAGKMGDVIRSGPSHEIEVFKRALEQGFVQFLGGQVLPALTEFAAWFSKNLLPPISTVARVVAAVLLPALAGLWQGLTVLVTVGVAVVAWLREWGIWLAPIGILIAGITLALSAQAIATAAVAAVMSVYRVAILTGTAITHGFAAAQALLNSVMALNPITLIVIALVALVAAIVIAYKKSDTFRKIVQAAWNGIKVAVMAAWGFLKTVFAALTTAFFAVGDAAVWLWKNAIRPAVDGVVWLFQKWWTGVKLYFGLVRAAVRVVAGVFTWIWKNVIAPWVNGIVNLVGLWWRGVQLYFQLVRAAIRVVASVFTWIWRKIIAPWVRGIINLVKLWWRGVQLYFKLVRAGVRAVANAFTWIWRKIVTPALRGIVSLTKLWWRGVRTYFNLVKAGIRAVADVFRWLWNKVIRPVWNGIKATIRTVWQNGIRPTFNALKDAVRAIRGAFRTAVDGIERIWNRLKGVAKKPVNFVIGTIYNSGIRKVWNTVAGFVGMKKLPEVAKLARGGRTRGGIPGKDSIPILAMADEFMIKRDSARKIGYDKLSYMNETGQLPGFASGGQVRPVQRFAKGGIVGDLVGGLGNLAGKIGGFAGDGLDFLMNPGKAFDEATGFIKDKLKSIGESKWAQAIAKMPGKMIRGLKDKLVEAAKGFLGFGGTATGSVAAAIRFARAQRGDPYVWGGAGPHGFDCSGFMGAIQNVITGSNPYRRMWSTHSFAGGPPPGWRRNLPAPFRVGITHAGVGHTAGTIAGLNVESRGGQGVVLGRSARGYNSSLFSSWYGFAPSMSTMDSGGKLPPGLSAIYNGTRRPEAVLTERQWQSIYAAARGGDSPSVHYEINARTADFTLRDLERVQRVQEARARIDRPR